VTRSKHFPISVRRITEYPFYVMDGSFFLFLVSWGRGYTESTWYSATNWPIVLAPDDR
jgi:hypothetical protein